jgi:hypothetical protein
MKDRKQTLKTLCYVTIDTRNGKDGASIIITAISMDMAQLHIAGTN